MDLDDTNLKIIIEPSSNLSHEQTPVAGASSVPQDESGGLNEMTPEDLDSLKKQVCEYASEDKWKEAESIFNKYPDMVRIPLTDKGDRALHVAVDAKSITFVKGLVNLMTPEDLEIRNSDGYTAFLMAAESGNSDLVEIMIKKNKKNLDSLKKLVYEYAFQDRWKDAESIFNKYAYMVRIPLTVERDRALHVAVDAKSITFVKGLVKLMTPQDLEIQNLDGRTAFLMAAESGNSDFVQIMIKKNQNLPLIKPRYGRLPVHLAASKGHHKIVQDLSSKTLLQKMDIKDIEDNMFDSLKKQVCQYAGEDKWKEAESIFNKYAEMVRIPLTDKGDIALHVAVDAKNITFVKGLVNLMTPQDLEIRNSDGYTAFLMAAESGNSDLVQIMIEKNQNLPLIKGTLPVHLAAINGHYKIVQDLSSKTLLQKMDILDIEDLFFFTIHSDMFDVTTKLFEEYPDLLAGARWGTHRTALGMLLRKPSKELRSSSGNFLQLLQKIWLQLQKHGWILKFIGGENRGASSTDSLQLLEKIWFQLSRRLGWEEILKSSWLVSAMADALESGNVEAVKCLLSTKPELVFIRNHDNEQKNILHYAVRQRHSSIVSLIFMEPPNYMRQTVDNVLQTVDGDGNNILHLAAYPLKKEENSSSLRATAKMTREVKWFKKLEKKVPRELRTMRNREGMTPKDIFLDKHKDLSREVKYTAKGIAESGMLVAALVATVAFAAAVTLPGDKTNRWFTVFILANAAALFTSSASILSFLSNFTTSKFADSEFVTSLHPSLILGLILLLLSIVTMIISFAAASFLIFEHTSKWAAHAVALMGAFPILLFLLFQFSIFDTYLWSRFYHMSFAQ